MLGNKPLVQWDAAGLLKLMWEAWNDVFGRTLGRAGRSLVQELRDWRNKWAHQEPFSSDDTDRALDSMGRLLASVSAPQADEVDSVARDDEKATSPGDVLRQLFAEYGPCLVLIDEWVAYARQLHDQSDLPAGSFETQFTFAQALTESAKLAKNCLLVVSLPASDMPGSAHAQADDVEVGGIRGREALDRLRNASNRRGGRRPRKKASRSSGAGCSSRSPASCSGSAI
jgi:hypothetical protein